MYPTLSLLLYALCSSTPASEKTAFQTAAGWSPELDLRSDIAIVYGVNPSFRDRLESWRSRGYGVHMMTGVAWGGYQDYLDGKFDGADHWHEGQVARDGTMIMHGARVGSPDRRSSPSLWRARKPRCHIPRSAPQRCSRPMRWPLAT
ncbi:hypothetical protein FJZ36_16790 [Candidatus Poribacteria bacterium]|nr:hypothetical protein [Candidatus Poribacteria bacterium]